MLLDVQDDHIVATAARKPSGLGFNAVNGEALDAFRSSANARKIQARLTLRLALIVGDSLALLLAFAAAAYIRIGDGGDWQSWSTIMIVTLPIYLGTALNSRAYDLETLRNFRASAHRSMLAFLFTIGTVTLMAFFLKASGDFSRLIFGIGTALSIPALVITRLVMIRVAQRVIGDNPYVELILQDGVPIDFAHDATVLDAAALGLEPSARDPQNIQRLGGFVRNVDRVIVVCSVERRAQWSFVLKALDINAELHVPELDDVGAVSMRRLGGGPTLVISTGPLPLRHRLLKRSFDLAVVFAMTPLLLIPMLIIAIAIKLESPGPALFRQTRIGLGNRPFHILKFRSMRMELCDADGNRSAGRDDDRITRIGKFIRATSIDELPQILNVFLGDMSLVGPRPHAIGSRAENMLFWDIDDRYWHRHAVKPGLTGLAQIRGFRGATEFREDLSNRLQADLEYRADWSLLRDISIILATFRVLVHRNAF